MVLDKGGGSEGGGFLPEPRTLSEGNYILIPLRNLVCIRLPGTSANCLQCLSLCLLGVCMCVCVPRFPASTPRHTNTHAVEGCDSPRNTTHAGVITMQVDSSNYCVNSCILFLGLFFPIDKKAKKKCIQKKPKKKKPLTACWTRVMLLTVRLLKPTHVNSSPHPLTPTRATTPLCLYEGHDVFKTQYFCILSVKCKEQGGC